MEWHRSLHPMNPEEFRAGPRPGVADHTSVHVQRAVRGEDESVAWVVAHFQPLVEAQIRLRLGRHASWEDVEDLGSDLWLVVLRRLGDIRPHEGRYAPVLVRFLGTTCLQLCNNFLRKRIRRGKNIAETATAHSDDSNRPTALDGIGRDSTGVVSRVHLLEVRDQIRLSLEALAPAHREVLVLRIMEQRSNQEIGAILKIEPNTAAVRYRRALDALRAGLPRAVFDDLCDAIR